MSNNKRFACVDEVIVNHNLAKDCVLPIESIRHLAKLSMLTNSMAYIFADAAESLLMDTEFTLDKLEKCLSKQAKHDFKQMKNSVHAARLAAKKAAAPMYSQKDFTEDGCTDSDWWYNLIKLIDDRIGNNKQKTNLLLDFLFNMPSEGDGLFNVTYDDFI